MFASLNHSNQRCVRRILAGSECAAVRTLSEAAEKAPPTNLWTYQQAKKVLSHACIEAVSSWERIVPSALAFLTSIDDTEPSTSSHAAAHTLILCDPWPPSKLLNGKGPTCSLSSSCDDSEVSKCSLAKGMSGEWHWLLVSSQPSAGQEHAWRGSTVRVLCRAPRQDISGKPFSKTGLNVLLLLGRKSRWSKSSTLLWSCRDCELFDIGDILPIMHLSWRSLACWLSEDEAQDLDVVLWQGLAHLNWNWKCYVTTSSSGRVYTLRSAGLCLKVDPQQQ